MLIDRDFKLCESTAIMQYLAGQRPNPLWPDDIRTRADITRWQSWQLAHWGKKACEPLLIERIVKQVLNLGPPDDAVVTNALACFERDAAILDAHLATQPYLAGDRVTLADFSVAVLLLRRGRGAAARVLSECEGSVRPCRGVAVLAGDRAAIHCRGGVKARVPDAAQRHKCLYARL